MAAEDLPEVVIIEVRTIVHSYKLHRTHSTSWGDCALANDCTEKIIEDSWYLCQGLEQPNPFESGAVIDDLEPIPGATEGSYRLAPTAVKDEAGEVECGSGGHR